MNWDSYFIKMVQLVSEKSKDPSTKCGALIVGPDHEIRSTGFNGFPRGVDETIESRWVRPEKYEWVEHAERNAIYNAARVGISTFGCTMYVNYAVECCDDCTRAIIQSGIIEVVGPDIPFPGKGKGIDYSKTNANIIMMNEAGILIRNVEN
jgi:dCMP deaminase